MKRITLKDLAKMANVATSTVSKALHNHPDISKALAEKIQLLAKELHFSPNRDAISLRSQKTKTIGLIIPEHTMHFMPSLIHGVNSFFNPLSYKTVVFTSQNSLQKEEQLIAHCCEHHFDGILMVLSHETSHIAHLNIATSWGIPIVIVDKTVEQNQYCEVLIDDVATAKIAAEYLVTQNCKSILAVLGNEQLLITQLRKKGFSAALKDTSCTYLYAQNAQEAQELCANAFAQHTFDGVFMMSDEIMLGVNAAMFSSQQLTIPRIAISEGVLPPFMTPPIPYVEHNAYTVGQVAAQRLHQQLLSESTLPQEKILISTALKLI